MDELSNIIDVGRVIGYLIVKGIRFLLLSHLMFGMICLNLDGLLWSRLNVQRHLDAFY